MTNVIISGGRDFDDYSKLEKSFFHVFKENNLDEVTILSGGATGADALGERFAKYWDMPLRRFPADWKNNGKAAGPIRNAQMARYGQILIAFWDGKSKGTANMIQQAKANNLIVHIVKY